MKAGAGHLAPGLVGLPRLAAQSSGVLAECKNPSSDASEPGEAASFIARMTRRFVAKGSDSISMAILRRFLLLAALSFWLGGFTFYATVVVPMGEKVLGSSIDQGFITQRVANYLNLAGAVALPLLFWDVAAVEKKSRLRAVSWLVMAASLVLLAGMHVYLDQFLDVETKNVMDHDRFYFAHEVYLTVCAVQWASGLAFLFTTLHLWRAEDQRMAETKLAGSQA